MFRYYFRTLQLLRLIPELFTLLWGPAEALLNFDYAFAGLFIPQRRVLFRNDPRGLIGLSALFTLYYPPKESSLSEGSLWLSGYLYLKLSPKGEFFRLSEGSLWFEWLSLPCLVVFGFLAPTTVSLIVRAADGRTADGRTDGTGVFTFRNIFASKSRVFFFLFF